MRIDSSNIWSGKVELFKEVGVVNCFIKRKVIGSSSVTKGKQDYANASERNTHDERFELLSERRRGGGGADMWLGEHNAQN